MNEKYKFGILILLISTCLVILFIVFSHVFISNTGNKSEEHLAVVTFFSNNSMPVVITCEVASSPEKRSVGLMFREDLYEYEGMLFVYESPHYVSFWMKNVLIPLDIIFLNENGTVVNVEEADVEIGVSDESLRSYCSLSPVLWVVEVNQGFSNLNDIYVGTNVSIEYL